MKKLLMIFASMLLSFYGFFAHGVPPYEVVEFRASYFYPDNSEFRKLFDSGGVDYQLTATVPVCRGQNEWLNGINVWLCVDYFSKTAHSKELDNKIKIRMVPITLGIKYYFPFCFLYPFDFYVAAGMKYYSLHTHNDSPCVRQTINRGGLGGVLEIGTLFNYSENFLVDIFASYSCRSFSAQSGKNPAVKAKGLNVSGFNFGGGIGYYY